MTGDRGDSRRGEDHAALRALLPQYVNGTLEPEERASMERHVAECAPCAAALAEWQAAAAATEEAWRLAQEPAPAELGPRLAALVAAGGAPSAFADVAPLAPAEAGAAAHARAAPAAHIEPAPVPRTEAAARPARRGPGWALRHAWLLLVAQVPVVRRQIWAASAMVVVIGAALVLLADLEGGDVFALLAPLVAAGGIALVYGPEVDPASEVLASTPTSPRAILIARLVLVLAYDTVAFLIGSLLLVWLEAGMVLGTLVLAWLGPMLLLSALCLVVALWLRPAAGVGLALALWALRVVSESPANSLLGADVAAFVRDAWSSQWLVILLAMVLFGIAVLCVPRARRVA